MNSTTSKKSLKILYNVIGIILLFVIIQILSFIKNDTTIFPNVIDIFRNFFDLLKEGKTYLFILHSVLELIIAVIASAIVGITFGVIGAINEPFRHIIKPFMVFIRSIPMIIIAILLITLVDSIAIPSVAAGLVIMPLFYESTKEGILNIDPNLLDVYKFYSNTNAKVVLKIHLPLIMGYTKQAFANAIGLGFKVIITSEYIAGVAKTLGYNIYSAYFAVLDFAGIYAYGLLLIIIVLIIEGLPNLALFVIDKIRKSVRKQLK